MRVVILKDIYLLILYHVFLNLQSFFAKKLDADEISPYNIGNENNSCLRGETNMNFHNKDGMTAYLQSLVDEELTPCISVAASYKGETVYAGTAARKNDPLYEGYNAQIRHNIGSVSKIITGALFAKALETGKLTVWDRVKKFLPEYPYEDNDIMQLLCHSTGYSSFIENIPRPHFELTTDEYVALICKNAVREYAPGTESRYFSLGYTLVMAIIERVTGMDYESFARKVLFDPIGMNDSTFDMHKVSPANTILPYNRDTDTYETDWCRRPTGDSGLYTTAADLLKFGNLLNDAYHGRENPVFTQWQAHYLFGECTEGKFIRTPAMWMKGNHDRYGFFGDFCSPEACGHTGYSGCMLMVDPTYEISIAILTNSCHLHMNWNNYRIISNRIMGEIRN